MKRALMRFDLPAPEREFTLDIPEPGIVRFFGFIVEQAPIVPSNIIAAPNQRVMREVAILLVEVDPDHMVAHKRKFTLIDTTQAVESDDELKYIGSVFSNIPGNGPFHLFEEVPRPALQAPVELVPEMCGQTTADGFCTKDPHHQDSHG